MPLNFRYGTPTHGDDHTGRKHGRYTMLVCKSNAADGFNVVSNNPLQMMLEAEKTSAVRYLLLCLQLPLSSVVLVGAFLDCEIPEEFGLLSSADGLPLCGNCK